MMKAAVVDDSREDAGQLLEYLKQFEKEHGIDIQTTACYASFDFLEEYHGQYDVVFLDIEMPGSNGLEVAREIRSKDDTVGLIFVTSMAQYAIEGYEVNAIDFMVKPVGYYNFSLKLEKALRFHQSRKTPDILISGRDGIRRICVSDIRYIEKNRDNLIFHTREAVFEERGSIRALKEKLAGQPFEECTSGCLVYLGCVKRIGKDSISLEGSVELPLSRRQKRIFTQEYIKFVGLEV